LLLAGFTLLVFAPPFKFAHVRRKCQQLLLKASDSAPLLLQKLLRERQRSTCLWQNSQK
jgi:hypothetical protein